MNFFCVYLPLLLQQVLLPERQFNISISINLAAAAPPIYLQFGKIIKLKKHKLDI